MSATNVKWVGKHVEVDPPKRPLKVTGTRFAAIQGNNRWSAPFKVWCEMTRTYKEPFEDTKYTIAGKVIEPKQADYLQEAFFGDRLIRPSDLYGEDAARAMNYDFFPDDKVFGGMWDYITVDENGEFETVIECKTTKRAEDWVNGPPRHYEDQLLLYMDRLGLNTGLLVVTFLEDADYEHPEDFVVSGENTALIEVSISKDRPDFPEQVREVRRWYEEHVLTGISPDYDERTDKDVLKELRTAYPDTNAGIDSLVRELERLEEEVKPVNARIKALRDALTKHMAESMQAGGMTRSRIAGGTKVWDLSMTASSRFDTSKFKADNPDLYSKYIKKVESLRLTSRDI